MTRFAFLIALVLPACTDPPASPLHAGGALTVFDTTADAFSRPAPSLSRGALERHRRGAYTFRHAHVPPPSGGLRGLGPVYNRTSCMGCHAGDGRTEASLVLRLSARDGGPVPGFGDQLQTRAVGLAIPEGRIIVRWTERPGHFDDGTPYSLRAPTYAIEDAYAALPAGVRTSPRAARPIFGLGLLEAVPDAAILALADPADEDGDGISGRPNRLASGRIGRIGWKASEMDVLQQTARAFHRDLGITSPPYPTESAHGQPQDDELRDDAEASRDRIAEVAFYIRTLGVPARRDIGDPAVRAGERLFHRIGCAACHTPELRTGRHPDVRALSGQTIRPYTDLLLHDMGPGLADGRPEEGASGREWRTAPLWGIGLAETVNAGAGFLHDGRARTLTEAVLWHGGEASGARERFRALSAGERAAMLRFLGSL